MSTEMVNCWSGQEAVDHSVLTTRYFNLFEFPRRLDILIAFSDSLTTPLDIGHLKIIYLLIQSRLVCLAYTLKMKS